VISASTSVASPKIAVKIFGFKVMGAMGQPPQPYLLHQRITFDDPSVASNSTFAFAARPDPQKL